MQTQLLPSNSQNKISKQTQLQVDLRKKIEFESNKNGQESYPSFFGFYFELLQVGAGSDLDLKLAYIAVC
jgi:hypothetical protein